MWQDLFLSFTIPYSRDMERNILCKIIALRLYITQCLSNIARNDSFTDYCIQIIIIVFDTVID